VRQVGDIGKALGGSDLEGGGLWAKTHTSEQIIFMLREAEVALGKGQTVRTTGSPLRGADHENESSPGRPSGMHRPSWRTGNRDGTGTPSPKYGGGLQATP